MSATFDATTTSEYASATTAAARSALIVAALTGTISVKVFNGSNVEQGTGTMTAPWATASGDTVTVGEVSSFTVGTTATPDANWYIRFQNAGATRWVRGSFGLAASGQDFTWSLATWTAAQTGTIGTATIITTGNSAPEFTVAPTAYSLPATGGTIQFTAVDPEGSTVIYSMTTRTGFTISSTTGIVTATSAAAGSSGNITVTASDGVLSTSATCAVTVAASSVMKWYPGHYAMPGVSDSQTTKNTLFNEIGTGWQGAQVRYYWGGLEPTQGNYDFSAIQTDRDVLAARGKKLFIQILSARFSASVGSLVPSYLRAPAYNDGIAVFDNSNDGIDDRVVIQLWNTAVMTRVLALEEALADAFDGDVSIAGLIGGETSLGRNAALEPFGFTPTLFLNQLKRRATANRAAWTQTPVIVFANFFSGWSTAQIQDLYEHMESVGIGCVGPDIYPDNPTTGQEYHMGLLGLQDYRGTIPSGYANQTTSVEGYPFSQLYGYARNTLTANFMFTLKSGTSMTTWAATKTYADANPLMNSTLPTVYT